MTKDKNLGNTEIPLKTVITIVITIVMWVSSLMGVYFTMKSQVDELRIEVNNHADILSKNNPEVLEVKITAVELEVTELNKKADKIYDFLNKK